MLNQLNGLPLLSIHIFLIKLESVATSTGVTTRSVYTELVALVRARFTLVNVATCPFIRLELKTFLTRAKS